MSETKIETGEVRVGTRVSGECGNGPVVAMSKQWCIYRDGPMEYAEPWEQIVIYARPVGGPASSIAEMTVLVAEEETR